MNDAEQTHRGKNEHGLELVKQLRRLQGWDYNSPKAACRSKYGLLLLTDVAARFSSTWAVCPDTSRHLEAEKLDSLVENHAPRQVVSRAHEGESDRAWGAGKVQS